MRFPEGLELRTYGQHLLAGREAKGWTQQQLSKKLFLPVHFIRALEAGEHGMLPEIPYVMSMYRKVAVAVDVDPEPMIQACKDFQAREGLPPANQPQRELEEVAHGANSSSGLPRQSRQTSKPEAGAGPQHTPQQKRRAGQGDGLIVLVGCALGLSLVAAVLLNSELWLAMRSRIAATPITTDPEAETGAETQDQASEDFPAQGPPVIDIPDTGDIQDTEQVSPEGPTAGPELGTVRFIFTADANDGRSSWVSIQDARGVLLFESVPEPFTSVDLPIATGIRVRLGRPGLVRWQQPGQPAQPFAESQAGVWMELIPGPAASRAAPATSQATAPPVLAPVPAP